MKLHYSRKLWTPRNFAQFKNWTDKLRFAILNVTWSFRRCHSSQLGGWNAVKIVLTSSTTLPGNPRNSLNSPNFLASSHFRPSARFPLILSGFFCFSTNCQYEKDCSGPLIRFVSNGILNCSLLMINLFCFDSTRWVWGCECGWTLSLIEGGWMFDKKT